MAEQNQPDPTGAAGEQQLGEAAAKENSSGLFLKLILPLFVVASMGLGGWLAYDQYSNVDKIMSATQETFSSVWGGQAGGVQYGEFKELKDIIVNPAGTNGQRYLMVALGLESSSSKALTEVENREVVVRDTILKILSQYTVDELASIEHRNQTKDRLMEAVNGVLGGPQIDRLYFTQYVLQ
jgi:flagellar FliL protein